MKHNQNFMVLSNQNVILLMLVVFEHVNVVLFEIYLKHYKNQYHKDFFDCQFQFVVGEMLLQKRSSSFYVFIRYCYHIIHLKRT